MSVICRKAVPEDVEPLYEMIKGYAERGIMLPRSREILHRQLEHFVVAEVDGEVVGCGSLCRLGNDLVEVRSLGISEGHKGLGIGSRLLDRLVEEAEKQQIPKVMALTYEVSFFLKNGFAVVEKEIFPEKVWTDCVHCSKQDCCDEIAVLKELNVSA
ncbi:N-acetyltransferase [Paenibacillus sp. FSL H7-0942]|jgi:amino-acid N-acetyltransferase|uniref:Acetyltransferase n=2 Tax=Paenibacillus TaxID=44249 RepID=A0A100VNF7_PAEAM|nr:MULTISPECIES: N-acetyltransferase [Paenibacillus]ETT44565.1 acetyltransferase [Paenibacillus sp. FSL H7-689]KAA8756043.1 N-acetyltransferase [Paenibacillus sp. UASWS1643]KLU55803.1 acetyltransferase [Paenibacillus sp. VT-400]MBD8839343.1 N-acetyltransferase [Paenibacillus sp. CFBP 13594]MBP2243580.1 amino-acid N-acetyltransferase [Paenibacillus xylanexedens]